MYNLIRHHVPTVHTNPSPNPNPGLNPNPNLNPGLGSSPSSSPNLSPNPNPNPNPNHDRRYVMGTTYYKSGAQVTIYSDGSVEVRVGLRSLPPSPPLEFGLGLGFPVKIWRWCRVGVRIGRRVEVRVCSIVI